MHTHTHTLLSPQRADLQPHASSAPRLKSRHKKANVTACYSPMHGYNAVLQHRTAQRTRKEGFASALWRGSHALLSAEVAGMVHAQGWLVMDGW